MKLKLDEKRVVEGCKKADPIAQRELYERLSSTMFGVCRRYVSDRETAEDILHDGFITIYTKIGEFRGEGSFEGWCRRIFVTTALGYLRKKNPLNESDNIDDAYWLKNDQVDAVERMSERELLDIVEGLPDGYRMVLNLYAIEGYSHKEIGEMLNVSEGTSRSQYSRARVRLQEMIGQREGYGEREKRKNTNKSETTVDDRATGRIWYKGGKR